MKELDLHQKVISFLEEKYNFAKSTRWDTYVDYSTTIERFAKAEGAAEFAVMLGLLTAEEAEEIKKRYETL